MTLQEFYAQNPMPESPTQEWLDRLWKYTQAHLEITKPEVSEHFPGETRKRPVFNSDEWEYDEWADYCRFPFWAKADTLNARHRQIGPDGYLTGKNVRYLLHEADSLADMLFLVLVHFRDHECTVAAIFSSAHTGDVIYLVKDDKSDTVLLSETPTC